MAEHNVTFELFYAGAWHPAPVYTRARLKYRRGATTPGNDTDPAEAQLHLDNHSGAYAPRSIVSPLYGLIGQNTRARLTVDGDIRMSGEVSSWKPQRAIKNDAWTPVDLSGVLRRVGRGTDPLQSPLTRAAGASDGLVAYWALEDGKSATSGANLVSGGAPILPRAAVSPIRFADVDDAIVPDGMAALPALNGGAMQARVTATSTTSWRIEWSIGLTANSAPPGPTPSVRHLTWTTPGGGITFWWCDEDNDSVNIWGTAPSDENAFSATVVSHTDPRMDDGTVHRIALQVNQVNGTDMDYAVYFDGVLQTSGTNTTAPTPQVGPPVDIVLNPDERTEIFTIGGVGVWSPRPVAPIDHDAVSGYAGETAADRFTRFCAEEGITATVAGESAAMGPQGLVTSLQLLDEIARTDDGSIFETKASLGLTMRTGVSRMNQAPDLTINYLGHIQPPLVPVFGDLGLRNDVTAKNPDGSFGRVVQETGPRNVQAPEDDPHGVTRYKTSVDVNTAADSQLVDVAGWTVNLGTFDGTWYAEVTVDLDAAPGLKAAVNALDIGDVLAIANLPADEALDTVEGVIIGIEEDLPPKRRLVTFYLVPADPYRVGLLAQTSGDTDPFVGHLDTDGTTTTTTIAAGATSFTVETPSGPLWTMDGDDFPFDVIVGSQRVSIVSIVNYLNANPYLETDAADWFSISNAGVFRNTVTPHEGIACLLVIPDGVTSDPGARTASFPVVAGRTYTYSAWVRVSSGGSASRDIGINWRNSSDGNISSSTQTQTPSPTVWTFYTGTAVAPGGAVFARLITTGPGVLAAANTWRVDEATVTDDVTQIFNVRTAGFQVRYAVAPASEVTVHQPIILAP